MLSRFQKPRGFTIGKGAVSATSKAGSAAGDLDNLASLTDTLFGQIVDSLVALAIIFVSLIP